MLHFLQKIVDENNGARHLKSLVLAGCDFNCAEP